MKQVKCIPASSPKNGLEIKMNQNMQALTSACPADENDMYWYLREATRRYQERGYTEVTVYPVISGVAVKLVTQLGYHHSCDITYLYRFQIG